MSPDEIVRMLEVAPRDVVTALVRHRGELCVTRFFARPVERALDAAVAAHVLGYQACTELGPEVAARLAGYRVRASLGGLAGLPVVLAAGVRRIALPGLAPLAFAYGNPYVTIRAHAGSPLPEVLAQLGPEARRSVLAAIVPIVARLHARGVAHGRLRPASFAVAGTSATLVELEPLRAIAADDDAAVGADREAIATLAAWLLGAPREAITLAALWDLAAAKPLADETVAVPDDGGDGTVFVPDD